MSSFAQEYVDNKETVDVGVVTTKYVNSEAAVFGFRIGLKGQEGFYVSVAIDFSKSLQRAIVGARYKSVSLLHLFS